MSSTAICSDDNFKVESVFDSAAAIRDPGPSLSEIIAQKVNPDVRPYERPLCFHSAKYFNNAKHCAIEISTAVGEMKTKM